MQTDNSQSLGIVPVARASLLQRRQGPLHLWPGWGEVGERHPEEGGSQRGAMLLDEELQRDCSQPDWGAGSEI